MFLAIINDTYAEVKSELADSNDEFAIMDYFKSHYQSLLGKLGKHQDQIDGIQAALKVSCFLHASLVMNYSGLFFLPLQLPYSFCPFDINRRVTVTAAPFIQ